jgi:hypothetical protein
LNPFTGGEAAPVDGFDRLRSSPAIRQRQHPPAQATSHHAAAMMSAQSSPLAATTSRTDS